MAEVAERVEKKIDWDAAVLSAKERLKKGRKLRENAACSFVGAKAGAVILEAGSVCHHFLHGKYAKFIVSSLQTGEDYNDGCGRILSREVETWFIDYLLNRSPYAATFISKDAVSALEENLVVSSGDHPGNLVGGAIVSLRRLWEHVQVARVAYDLSQLGVNEDLAFLLGHCIQAPSEIEDNTSVQWSANLNWHTSIDVGFMDFKSVKDFLAHTPEALAEDNYAETGCYTGYSAMFGNRHAGGIAGYVRGHFPYEGCKAKVTASVNPFTASLPQKPVAGAGKNIPYSSAITTMAEWANTHLMEKIQNA